ncbi:MAG: ATP-binding protein [Vicinamibacteraceae bacterium]
MKVPWSLRGRLLVGAALWTVGLFGLAIVLWHVALGNSHPPALMRVIFGHAGLVAVICAGCLAAGLVQVRRGWSPINQLRARLVRLEAGVERRLDGEYPSEVTPLVGDLNALLEQREQSVLRARAKAGDLAHGLKTPLAVLLQEADRAAAAGHADLADAIRQQVDRMRRQVDYQLAQARADALAEGRAGAAASVAASAEGLARTLRRLYAERGVAIDVDVAAGLQVRVEREDLDEMLGNLLDNACKWARTRATISAALAGDRVVVTIDDDGPGIAPALRDAVFERGVRADEAAPGSGLGLAIVRDLATACGGAVAFADAPIGGLRVRLDLPAAGA